MNNKFVLQTINKGSFEEDVIYKALLFNGETEERLFRLARTKRTEYFPSEEVEVRSVIEISNICQRKCNFCNINSYSKRKRYTIKYEEFMKIVENLYYKGRRVLLLQSGENRYQKYIDLVCKYISNIKKRFSDLTIILCLGNLGYNQYKQLREAGADRYILKFETSNSILYKQIKPDDSLQRRMKCLEMLVRLGFDLGTGNLIGLPGQTLKDIVNDLFFIRNFKLTMMSTSVFIPGEDSGYYDKPIGNLDIALNYMALMRIMYPQMLIPSTSSLEKAKKGGQYLGLMAGANTVTIHDGTPVELKKYYPIYSVKRFVPDENYVKGIVTKAHLHFKK
jgi:biotin synthase